MIQQGRRDRRITTLALATAAALAAVSFGGAATAADPVGEFEGQEIVLSRWAGDPWTAGQMAAAEEWAAATGGTVVFDAIPYENLRDKQALTLSSGGDYDMAYIHPSWFGEFA